MKFEIITIDLFKKQFKKLHKKYKSLKTDIEELANELIENPELGTPLGKDCYKVRLAIKSKGKGKSGGARVITYIKVIDNKIYLLTIYDKSERDSISDKELKKILKQL